MGFSGEGKLKHHNYQLVMVPRGGIEPPTRGFSIDVSYFSLLLSVACIKQIPM